MFKRRECIIFIVVTLGVVTLTLLQLNQLDFIYGIGQVVLDAIFFLAVLYAIFRLLKDKREISFFEKLKPLLLAVVLTGFFFLVSYLNDTDGGKKRVMSGGVSHDLHFINFQLFSDSTFKLINSGPFGGPIYRGRYSLYKDTLFLKNDSLKHLYPSLTFVLNREKTKSYFAPVDRPNDYYRLYVIRDYRSD